MLNKVAIVTLVIRYVEIIFHESFIAFIMKVRVPNPGNMDKNGHLIVMSVHGLHFILDFKAIVFCKIYH